MGVGRRTIADKLRCERAVYNVAIPNHDVHPQAPFQPRPPPQTHREGAYGTLHSYTRTRARRRTHCRRAQSMDDRAVIGALGTDSGERCGLWRVAGTADTLSAGSGVSRSHADCLDVVPIAPQVEMAPPSSSCC